MGFFTSLFGIFERLGNCSLVCKLSMFSILYKYRVSGVLAFAVEFVREYSFCLLGVELKAQMNNHKMQRGFGYFYFLQNILNIAIYGWLSFYDLFCVY